MKEFRAAVQENFGNLSNDEINILSSYFYEEKLAKYQFFLKTHQYCQRLSFVKSGLIRIYRLSDEKEITQWISTPNTFITEILSFFYHQPSRLYIQALSDVELWTIDRNSYEDLCNQIPKWKFIETHFIAKCFAILEDRVFSHLSMSAEKDIMPISNNTSNFSTKFHYNI